MACSISRDQYLKERRKMTHSMTDSQKKDWEDTWIDEVTVQFLRNEDLEKLKTKWEVIHFYNKYFIYENMCYNLF